MLKRVVVFGAHSYFGFKICEKLINESVEVKGILLTPKDIIAKKLLEERMMLVGRNALFQINEKYERTDAESNTDLIIHCSDDCEEPSLLKEDRINLKKSVELAKEINVPFLFIFSKNNVNKQSKIAHIEFCKHYLNNNLETRTIIQLPILYGPFQPPTDAIHELLANYVKGKKCSLVINHPLLFIQDAVEAVWDLAEEVEQGKTYSFQNEVRHSQDASLEVEININLDEIDDEQSEKYVIKDPTSIKEGLKAQIAYIEKYREILKV